MNKWLSLVGISLLLLLPQVQGWSMDFDNTPKLVVKGEASIFKPADQMEVTLGVVTVNENSSVALNENNQRMHQIIENIKELGFDETDYQTGRFHIRPIYQKPSKDSEEEQTKILRYEVVNSIQIKTKKIDLVDRMLSAAVEGGANQIDKLQFNLHNPQSYREEVIKLATQYALMDASALASAAGVRLVRILNISLDNWQQIPGPVMFAKHSEAHVNQDLMEPGQAEIHASVNVTFEIGAERR